MKKKDCIDLDLSALAYPMMQTKNAQSLFRIEVDFDFDINPEKLRESVNEAVLRYPNFNTRLKRGAFWYKFVKNTAEVPVGPDVLPPLYPLKNSGENRFPFRVAYREKMIVCEVFHSVTDGNVALRFLSDTVQLYLQKCGVIPTEQLPETGLALGDAFKQYAKKTSLRKVGIKKYNGSSVVALGKAGCYANEPGLIAHTVSSAALHDKAHEMGASVSVYVAACYIASILQTQQLPLKKPLSLFIPINLRHFFPSDTLQNFVCFMRITMPKGYETADVAAVIAEVKSQFAKNVTKENLQQNINDINKCFTFPLVHFTPLFIKQPLFNVGKRILDKVRQTAIISNLGVHKFAPQVEPFVKNLRLYINISKNTPLNLGVITKGEYCNVCFTSLLKTSDIPERFFNTLGV